MNTEPAVLDIRAPVATLTLNDPANLNTLTEALLGACLDALDTLRREGSARVLVIKAEGKGFCAGANLSDLDPSKQPPGEPVSQRVDALLRDLGHRWVREIRTLEIPVLCAVHGVAAGGGVGFALAADLVVAARSSYFYLPFVPALGLVPDMGAGWFLPRRIGEQRAMAMALLGGKIPAEEAERWGMIYRCIDDERWVAEVDKLAARLAALPAHGIREMRALMDRARVDDLSGFLEYERDRQRTLIGHECFAEGVAAFREARPPNFPGRG